ncbi:uncharacterized protein LOC133322936 [Musca vetustissima]|uniref:uncharacterized protein LOC133322936 n=1 Tax=Musca vetustissima TaxID=27455 RepID=UPI002AB7B2EF|nr:uncharacterized protein LOC133322936 [Musca vetustissima]
MLSRAFIITFVVALTGSGIFITNVSSADIQHSGIVTVTNETRYFSQHPDVKPIVFNKEYYAKGNVIFTCGERIDGDQLLLTFMDEDEYTSNKDVEVYLRYPASGLSRYYISYVSIYTYISSTLADAYFVGGGIRQSYAEILMVANKTSNFGYQINFYGF